MHPTRIHTGEVYDFRLLPNPLKVGVQPVTSRAQHDRHDHPQVGTLHFRNLTFPHMHIVDMRWDTAEAVQLFNHIPTNTVNFHYQLTGENVIHFEGIGGEWRARAGEHSMYYEPDGDFFNRVAPGQQMEVLHISLDKAFFAAAIGHGDRWCERVQRDLSCGRAFTGAGKALGMSPVMARLIGEVRRAVAPGPLESLKMQSAVLELIALQVEQMQGSHLSHPEVSRHETDRLHELKSYLDTHFLTDLSLTQLSRQCGLNEFKVKRGFKLLFGMPVFAYIRKKRMEYAMEQLQRRGASVEEVAMDLGYQQAHHFSAAFKSYIGASPSAFKGRG